MNLCSAFFSAFRLAHPGELKDPLGSLPRRKSITQAVSHLSSQSIGRSGGQKVNTAVIVLARLCLVNPC